MREAEYDRSDSLDALLPADERTPIGNAVGRSIVQGDDAALAQALAQLRDVPREGPPAMWIALYAGDPSAARQAIETFEASEAGRASEAAGVRVMVNNVMHLVIPLVFGSVGTAFGYMPVFLSNSALLTAGGFLMRRKPALEAP